METILGVGVADCLFLSSPAAVMGGGDASCHLLGKVFPKAAVCLPALVLEYPLWVVEHP